MALIEANRVKRITSTGGTLTAPANRSYRLRDIYCNPQTSNTYAVLNIAGRSVLQARVLGLAGNHAPYPANDLVGVGESKLAGLMDRCRSIGVDLSIPIPTGMTLSVALAAGDVDVALLYDAYDAGDVAADEPNGPEASEFRRLLYGTNTAAITASPAAIDKSLIWTGGDKWPFDGSAVPTGWECQLHAILGCPVFHGDASVSKGCTTHLTLWRSGDVMFDTEDQVGLPFLSDAATFTAADTYIPVASMIGPWTAEISYPPLVLGEPVIFRAGETLSTTVTVGAAAASGIGAAAIDLAYLVTRRRVG